MKILCFLKKQAACLGILFFAVSVSFADAQGLRYARPFEAIKLRADSGLFPGEFYGKPIEKYCFYSWDAAAENWREIPFQINEEIKLPNPHNTNDSIWFQLIPHEYEGTVFFNEIFDAADHIIVLSEDLGDTAPSDAWIDCEESLNYPRLELSFTDPLDSSLTGTAYVFLSESKTTSVKKTAGQMRYYPDADSVAAPCYSAGFNRNYGIINSIALKPPAGSEKNLFDRIKLRFGGIIDLFVPLRIVLNEESLVLYPTVQATENPVLNVHRMAEQTIRIGPYVSDETKFYTNTAFYPYSAHIRGGASIKPEDLDRAFPDADMRIYLDYLRYSWDFNENAAGMTFMNAFNANVIVDGMPDTLNTEIILDTAGVFVWHVLTGDEGSIFLSALFKETNWDSAAVYYDDNADPGRLPADWNVFSAYNPDYEDTGDSLSFGDAGVLFKNKARRDSITLELNFDAYFLPVQNMTAENARLFALQAVNPVLVSSKTQVFGTTSVQETANRLIKEPYLEQVYPNPFNQSANIVFSLPEPEKISLNIVDMRGRMVYSLYSGTASRGRHVITWNGTNQTGMSAASGLYFVRLETDKQLISQKILMIR